MARNSAQGGLQPVHFPGAGDRGRMACHVEIAYENNNVSMRRSPARQFRYASEAARASNRFQLAPLPSRQGLRRTAALYDALSDRGVFRGIDTGITGRDTGPYCKQVDPLLEECAKPHQTGFARPIMAVVMGV